MCLSRALLYGCVCDSNTLKIMIKQVMILKFLKCAPKPDPDPDENFERDTFTDIDS